MNQKNIFAFTPADAGSHPPYVSLNEYNGELVLTMRGYSGGGSVASTDKVVVSAEDLRKMAAGINAYLAATQPPANAAPVGAKPFGYIATLTSPGGTLYHYSRVMRDKRDAEICAKQWANGEDAGVLALYTAQPSPAQGEALSQRAASDYTTLIAKEAFQQGRAAGIEEAAKWLSDHGCCARVEEEEEAVIRALAAKNGEGKS